MSGVRPVTRSLAAALGLAFLVSLFLVDVPPLTRFLGIAFLVAMLLVLRALEAARADAVAAARRAAARSDERTLGTRLGEGLREPLLLLDPERRVRDANRAARALFDEGMVGRDVALHLRHPAVLEAIGRVRAGAEAVQCEIRLAGPGGRVYAVSVSRIPAAGRDGADRGDETAAPPYLILVFLHEITALRQAERMRVEFVANASHELRTPLSALIGFIETLRGPAKDDAAARERFLAIMDAEARRMARLIEDLLTLSRIERDVHLRPEGRVALRPLCEAVVRTLEPMARARDMTVTLDLPADLPPLRGDPDQLTQVVQNLLANALKYATAATTVTVRARAEPDGRSLRLEVGDEGPGIAPAHLPRLTERFYRVDTARSREAGGTGLGLAIVKHVVARHGGRLEIASAPGEGTTVRVTLPAADSGEAAQGSGEAAQGTESGQTGGEDRIRSC
ncbi:MAG: sensor histidine kinase [Rhodothalassiaceae bacterium]